MTFTALHDRVCYLLNGFKQLYLLIAIRADSRGVIVLRTIIICTVVEGAVTLSDRTASSLVLEMPIEADKGTMLVALVLKEGLALFDTKLF